ncbi:MAG: FAD-dependent oxidoreductase [Epulopiscium sp.]|nr:FAD-dependent oxidoreductase [Candidatus Epulonipiscium sp.]
MEKNNRSSMFTTISAGSTKLKNRFVVSPMVTVYCDEDGMATDQYISYYEARAKGGWGLIITEDYAVDPAGRGFFTPGLWKDEQIESHTKLTDRIHRAGAKVFAQIYHAGRQTTSGLIGQQTISASPIPCPVLGETPRQLAREEIKKIVSQFGDTALRAKKAGFDGIEVHGGHGYLIAQFMSGYSNKRWDEYGGNIKNRMRFPLEIIADIREKCGPDFTIGFRLSADEYVPRGRTIEETRIIVKMLEEAGVDLLNISAGVYGSTWAVIPPLNVRNGWIVHFAEDIKKIVDIPVITVGRINDPLMGESIIDSGKADLIAMGRGSLADPDLPNKFLEGRYEDIRHCIGCQQGCVSILFLNKPIRCLVNPTCGFEYLDELKKADKPKKVIVVGGGPGGMEAARAAALSGHEVSLYEQTGRLGGEFAVGAIPPEKGDLILYSSWVARQIKKLGVDINLQTEFTAKMLDEKKPDKVIIATGSHYKKPNIPGIDKKHIVNATDVLLGNVEVGQKVVVLGGGLIGSETATYLGENGKDVTIVEQKESIAIEEEGTRRKFLMELVEDLDIKLMTNTKLLEINNESVHLERSGVETDLKADTVVLALGLEPNANLEEEIKDRVDITIVGDAIKPRDALEAIREGFLAGAGC